MIETTSKHRKVLLTVLLISLSRMDLVLGQYSPDHPTVQKMVERGMSFLETSGQKSIESEYQFQAGGVLLVGYTFLKVTGDPDHPLVKRAITNAVKMISQLKSMRDLGDSKIVYETSVACLLLADADANLYRSQLEAIRDWLVRVQKPHGGFGYFGQPTGDTSQTQYAMLAMWTLHAVGVDVPVECVEGVIQYLKATQDPTGGWGYQGVVGRAALIKQDTVTKSLSTAGLGAIIIGGDVLGFYRGRKVRVEEEADVPKAFVRVDLTEKERVARKDVSLSINDISGTIALGNRWQNQNSNEPLAVHGWYFYYRYSQERYESFLEVMEGKSQKSPAWYNAGVEELKQLQTANGAWLKGNIDICPDDVCTAFAVLYLIRSTQRAIGKINEGILAGGYGLPKNVASVQRVGDRIVNNAEMSVENLLQTLESHDTNNMEIGLVPKNLQLSSDPKTRSAQVSRLSRLLFAQDWKSRRIAAKLLGRSDDINRAPELIQALTDNDPEVPALAEESLRLLSRKLTVRNVDYNATFEQKKQAFEYWKDWYLSVRPDYIFLSR